MNVWQRITPIHIYFKNSASVSTWRYFGCDRQKFGLGDKAFNCNLESMVNDRLWIYISGVLRQLVLRGYRIRETRKFIPLFLCGFLTDFVRKQFVGKRWWISQQSFFRQFPRFLFWRTPERYVHKLSYIRVAIGGFVCRTEVLCATIEASQNWSNVL